MLIGDNKMKLTDAYITLDPGHGGSDPGAVKYVKEAKKKQKIAEIKEVRLSPNIDKHDLEVKAKNTNKFIDAGNKVKVTMRFRGRELNFIEQGKEIMSNSSIRSMICI